MPASLHMLSTISRLPGWRSLAFLLVVGTLQAEVKFDGSLGRNGTATNSISSGRTIYSILDTDGQTRGTNLFHSFEKFDLSSVEEAHFLGPGTIKNILTRVTNGTASTIDGKIWSQITGANLFLMNPKGIVFGPNAKVDVSGSFFATTADYIKLGADGRFAATPNAGDSVLTVSDPAAFGFLTPNPAAIQVNGSKLTSANVKTLGFIGGDVSITGDAELEAEDVQLISVRSVGETGLQLPGIANTLRWAEINVDGFSRRGTVTVDRTPVNRAIPAVGEGIISQRVVIRGGTFVMKEAAIATANSQPGDGIKVEATESLQMSGSYLISGNFGDARGHTSVDISAGEATLERSFIGAETASSGAGGSLHMEVSGALRLSTNSALFTNSYSSIAGGDLAVSAGSIRLENSSGIQANDGDFLHPGIAGNLTVTTGGAFSLTGRSTISMVLVNGQGQIMSVEAGNIFISGLQSGFLFQDFAANSLGSTIRVVSHGALSIQNAGEINVQSFSQGGVLIDVQADSLLVSGANTGNPFHTGISSISNSGMGGKGGDIRLTIAGALELLDGGGITTDERGMGRAGNIEIKAREATVTGRGGSVAGLVDASRGITARNRSNDPNVTSGSSGNIHLTVSGQLDVRDAGEILADTYGSGGGGSIQIDAGGVNVSTSGVIASRTYGTPNGGNSGNIALNIAGLLAVGANGTVTTNTAGSGAAGNITVRSSAIRVSGPGASISAATGSPGDTIATGAGGSIFLETGDLLISNGGQITATTYNRGTGGSIRIDADQLRIQDGGGGTFAAISAQTVGLATGGAGGLVSIHADSLDLRGAGALISTGSLGAGDAGQIQVTAGTVSLREGAGIQSSSVGAGRAGSVDLRARQTISLRDGGFVSVASTQSDAGNIHLRAGISIRLQNASITAESARNGGNIDLRTRDRITLLNSEITAAAGLNGGNIFIDPIFVFLDSSVISANAIAGRGGNIRIISDFYFASPGSLVTATSQLGVDGTVRIDALNNDLRDNLVDLPSELIDADSLLRDLCTMKMDDFSSFVSEGRGGLPPLPGEPLPSLMILP